MSPLTLAFLLSAAFVTAVLTGVFGLAGGLVLMGAVALVLPVSAAFVTHGLIQIVANFSRAVLHRKHIAFGVLAFYAAGSLASGLIVALAAAAPSKAVLFLLLGLLPALVWLPKGVLELDAEKPLHALACGLSVTGLNLSAGVAGPLLDVFFVKTAMTRHRIVATKAATQVLSHFAKIAVYGAALTTPGSGMPPYWFFLLAIPLSVAGTVVGGKILDRLTDANFLKWTRWIVTGVGACYLVQAARLFAG